MITKTYKNGKIFIPGPYWTLNVIIIVVELLITLIYWPIVVDFKTFTNDTEWFMHNIKYV